jgi:alkylated DNA repair dioxygenase AlkB
MFGAPVIGVSLVSPCRMRFRKGDVTFTQILEPRSLYLLAKAARTVWQHHIPPTNNLRYSITMRTIRKT